MKNKGIVLVANMGEDSVFVYDMKTLNQIDRIMLESIGNKLANINHSTKRPVIGPGYLYYYKKNNLIFVINAYDDSLSIYNLTVGKLENTIFVGRHPNQIVVIENIERAFVSNYDSNSISVIDLSAREIIGQIPCGIMPQCILLDNRTNYLYIANAGSNYISVIDALSLDKLPCLKVDGYPAVLTCDNKNNKMYIVVRCLEERQKFNLLEYDMISGKILRKISLGYMPVGILFDDRKGRIYVIDAGENCLKTINVSHLSIEKTIRLGRMPLGQCTDAFVKHLYVVCALDNSLYKIDTQQWKIIKKIHTGAEPVSVLCID